MNKVKKKPHIKDLNPRQKALIEYLKDNPTTTMREAMIKNGYSVSYARTPNLLKSKQSYKRATQTAIETMTRVREKIIDQMEKHLDSNDIEYSKLSQSVETINKNLRLLSNESTENTVNVFKLVE